MYVIGSLVLSMAISRFFCILQTHKNINYHLMEKQAKNKVKKSSKHSGIYYATRKNRWLARYDRDTVHFHVGSFLTEEAALAALDAHKKTNGYTAGCVGALPGERWKGVVGHESQYAISNMGRVKSLDYSRTGEERLLSEVKTSHGYKQFSSVDKTFYNKEENSSVFPANHQLIVQPDLP